MKINRIRFLAMITVIVLAGAFACFRLAPGRLYEHEVSVRELHEHPSLYVGQKVKTLSYLVKHTTPHFGDTYTLCEIDPRNQYFSYNPCIAISGSESEIDVYVSLFYNRAGYELAPSLCSLAVPCRVLVSGTFIDRGAVTDAAQYVIDVSTLLFHQ